MKLALPRSPRLGSFRALHSSLLSNSQSSSTNNWQRWSCRQFQTSQRSSLSFIFSPSRRRSHYTQHRSFAGPSLSEKISGYQEGDTGRGSENTNEKSRKRTAIQIAAAGGALGVAALTFSDDVKHAYAAAERTGRVVSALAVCINE